MVLPPHARHGTGGELDGIKRLTAIERTGPDVPDVRADRKATKVKMKIRTFSSGTPSIRMPLSAIGSVLLQIPINHSASTGVVCYPRERLAA